jgi:Cu/Ag efflux pump CusA
VQKAISGIKGVASSNIILPVQQLTVETEVNIDKAQRYGLKPGDVRRAAATLLSGIQVGSLFEQQKVFDVVVWSTPETRANLNDVANLLIDTPDGSQVRLGDVANVRIVPTDSVIRHEAVKRYMDVTIAVRGQSLAAVAMDVKSQLSLMQFPLEYHAEVLSDYVTQQATQARLIVFPLAALLAIYFLFQAAIGSWRLAALLLFSLPVALSGGVLAAFALGGNFSIAMLAGLLALFGIAVRNNLLLIGRYQRLQQRAGETFGVEMTLRGACERFMPALVTAFAVSFAFLPSVIWGDVPGMEIMRPMAIVMIAGLVTATLHNLFILPALYYRLHVLAEPEFESFLQNTAPTPSMGSLAEAPAGSTTD